MIKQLRNLSKTAQAVAWLVALPVVLGVAYFGYWTLSPLFYDVKVSEELRINDETKIAQLAQGDFIDGDSLHKSSGKAKLIRTDATSVVLRFEEDFKTTNGPDLYVWLVRDGKPEDLNGKYDYVELGRLTGNIGSQNYELPLGTDLSRYNSVIIWCKAFGVLFGWAQLTSDLYSPPDS